MLKENRKLIIFHRFDDVFDAIYVLVLLAAVISLISLGYHYDESHSYAARTAAAALG